MKAKLTWILASLLTSTSVFSADYNVSGVIDVRAVDVNGIASYLQGDYGKFQFNPTTDFVIGQAGIHANVSWEDSFSAHLIANAYADGIKDGVGITEAYFSYQGLPSENGYRIKVNAGLMYPRVSLENNATAWSSPFSLNYSTINSWVGEELRHLGAEFEITRLGKFHQSEHDFSLALTLLQHNDTTGAMLSWHGWTMSSRQTLWHETLPLADMPARISGKLKQQAPESDPFIELDNQIGYHLTGKWQWREHGEVHFGYYDNNADTRVVKLGQYTWLTTFLHLGVKWQLADNLLLIAQSMHGNTEMHAPTGLAVVDNPFANVFIMLSKRWQHHRITARVEEFSIDDNDNLAGDNNDEYGKAVSVAYRNQLNKQWFVHLEHQWIKSRRPSRYYEHFPVNLIERQWQLGVRYYF